MSERLDVIEELTPIAASLASRAENNNMTLGCSCLLWIPVVIGVAIKWGGVGFWSAIGIAAVSWVPACLVLAFLSTTVDERLAKAAARRLDERVPPGHPQRDEALAALTAPPLVTYEGIGLLATHYGMETPDADSVSSDGAAAEETLSSALDALDAGRPEPAPTFEAPPRQRPPRPSHVPLVIGAPARAARRVKRLRRTLPLVPDERIEEGDS